MMNKILLGALGGCETKAQVEDTFKKYEVSDFAEKNNYILKTMGSPEVFYSGRTTAPETAYYTNLSAFLTGAWRIFVNGARQ
jgi:hypothetical protein